MTSGSGLVEIGDILAVLAAWGNCPQPCPPYCLGDINEDCVVGVNDLLMVLAAWGCGHALAPPEAPDSVQDCIDKYGFGDPDELAGCIEAIMLTD